MDAFRAEFKKLFSEERTRKIFAEVFDKSTIDSVHALSQNGYFDRLEFLVNTGKEAHVFHAIDLSGNVRAVKVYKMETTDFKNMREYIEGDPRFGKIKRNARAVIEEWVKKEFRNLQAFARAGIRTPLALAYKKNVLVMEFIGRNGEAAPRLREAEIEKPDELADQLVDILARMRYLARIVHADLSEFNILWSDGPVVIDCAQSVSLHHPRAQAFFDRDIKNVSKFMTRKGIHWTETEWMQKIEERGKKLRERPAPAAKKKGESRPRARKR